MAVKSGKSRSNPKPKAGKGRAAPKKQLKSKSPVRKKTKAQLEKQIALKEATARVKMMKSALRDLRSQVGMERERGVPDPEVLKADVARTQSQLAQIQSELSQAKALSRRRKDEIDGWKNWYEKLPAEEKTEGFANLQNEINWRASELDANGQKINTLMLSELEAQGVFEMASQRLAAFEEGVHNLPVEKDPRLKRAQAEHDKAVAAFAALQPKKAKRK